jgi:hypothetical protein
MPQPIVRMFDTHENASAAVAALQRAGFTDLHSVAGKGMAAKSTGARKAAAAPGSASMSFDNIVALIAMGNILKSEAMGYAEGVSRGKSLVIVHPPFGRAVRAIRIMSQFNPVGSGVDEPIHRPNSWDEATPMSCALGMPVLMKDDPAPLSRFWGLSPLASNSFSLSSLLGMRLLSKSQSNWTSSFGFPLLSRPKSNWTTSFGLPLLSKSQGGWTKSFGLPLLTKKQ